ncbi:glycoside hydrolase family 127 protein [Paraglaciecola sp. L1A13]|uniref:glycoside hydrolase family 127 protein n=1 Tax=Paraglaciecola sp. L1A13 TaxID=2686359 RepID=UPI001E4C0FF8|nr:glycoside hydrolase family 127 protein [Paraglaciecola sp. L1A13]|tara:strand:+ start:265 stop:462 length:198 start_codon:yes stop_codon:yes gene_type:complete
MPMHIQFVEGQPPIEKVRNQAAVKRGPLVYCIETSDTPEKSGILVVYIDSDSDLKANYRDDFWAV